MPLPTIVAAYDMRTLFSLAIAFQIQSLGKRIIKLHLNWKECKYKLQWVPLLYDWLYIKDCPPYSTIHIFFSFTAPEEPERASCNFVASSSKPSFFHFLFSPPALLGKGKETYTRGFMGLCRKQYNMGLLYFVIMEPPPRLLWWSAVPTILHIAIIICRTLLQKESPVKKLIQWKQEEKSYYHTSIVPIWASEFK